MTPRATYRLQFSAAFRFADAAALAPYLARLGVSHVYASPVFAARPGSSHGYDVTDPNRLNPELGTEAEFRAMAATFRDHGLGLLLDIVPNHMGIGGDANAFWLDVLRWGPASPFAAWFDIDWDSRLPRPRRQAALPLPRRPVRRGAALGRPRPARRPRRLRRLGPRQPQAAGLPGDLPRILRESPALAALARRFEGATPATWPDLRPLLADAAPEAMEEALAAFRGRDGVPSSWEKLDALIGAQHWRAAHSRSPPTRSTTAASSRSATSPACGSRTPPSSTRPTGSCST
jgi:(1->4)-alpha-D-glucan 1-alpha-D-glucosylmutase